MVVVFFVVVVADVVVFVTFKMRESHTTRAELPSRASEISTALTRWRCQTEVVVVFFRRLLSIDLRILDVRTTDLRGIRVPLGAMPPCRSSRVPVPFADLVL